MRQMSRRANRILVPGNAHLWNGIRHFIHYHFNIHSTHFRDMEITKINLEFDPAGNMLPFSTGKHSYTPIQIGTPVGFKRWTEYEKMQAVVGIGKSFSSIVETDSEVINLLSSEKPYAVRISEAILTLGSRRKGVIEMSKARFTQAAYMATLFIIQDGDPNPLDWSEEKAGKIVQDWQESGVNEQQMFFFALSIVSGFSTHFQKIKSEIEEREERLSAITGLKKTEKIGD